MDTLKKLSTATKAILRVSRDNNHVLKLSQVLFLTSVGTVFTALPGWADPLQPSGVTVTVPSGSNNGTRNGTSASTAYRDDILLNTMTFGSTTFSSSSIRRIQQVRVRDGEEYINAEFGDSDTNSDGNPNPFVAAKIISEGATLTDNTRESTNPNIQNPAIRASFNTLSLSQGIDGEDEGEYTYDLTFTEGIVDNNGAADSIPELVFFERGDNSDFSVQAIIGGTLANPTLSTNAVTIDDDEDIRSTGIFIDTIEIGNGQVLGAVGLDLDEFGGQFSGNDRGPTVYGIRITSLNNTGVDMYGHFATAQNSNQFRTPPAELVPFEFSPGLGILALGACGAIAQLKSKVKKWKALV